MPRLAVILLLAFAALAAPAQGATFNVTTTADGSGVGCTPASCTLRAAIAAAAANGNAEDDTVVLQADDYQISALSGGLSIPASATRITLAGAGADATVIMAPLDFRQRLLSVGAGAGATVTGLTLDGNQRNSGGIVSVGNGATATLDRVHVTRGAAAIGGGLMTTAPAALTIRSSLFDANTANAPQGVGRGGGAYVFAASSVTIQDSTFTGNTADGTGGGLWVSGSVATLSGVTIAYNRTTVVPNTAGGLAGGAVSVQGSIIRGNEAGVGSFPNCPQTGIVDGGDNLTGTDCAFGNHADPQLSGSLDGSFSPPVLTIPLTSPAVDSVACPPGRTDQRGLPRPQGVACDAGAYEIDQAATLLIASGPSGTVTKGDAQFTFVASESGITASCRLSGPGQTGTYATCANPNQQAYTGLANGTYTFSVRDAAFPNATPATRTFTVAAPDSTITGGPSGATSSRTPSFTFTTVNAVSSQCRIDAGAFAACTSPHTAAAVADGPHTFEVRSLASDGTIEAAPAARAFTVDATPPDTTITNGPPDVASTATATFTFTSSESGSTFQCSLDNGAFGACPANYAGLAEGAHRFRVRALDAVGNADPTPAERNWTVDTALPDTTLTPIQSPTNNATPGFAFASNKTGRFECSVDSAALAPCTSPYTAATLTDGSHTFSVRAVALSGLVDGTPATQTFTVDTIAPSAPSATASLAAGPTVMFTGGAEAGSTVEAREGGVVRGSAVADQLLGSFEIAIRAVPDGTHEYALTARDAAGNTSVATIRTVPVGPAPTPTPTPTVTASPTPAGTASPSATATATVDASPTPTATPTAEPPPVINANAAPVPAAAPTPAPNAVPAGGTVRVRVPGAKVFVALTPALLPSGAEIDARKGRVTLTGGGGDLTVSGGLFKLAGTTLTLSQPGCKTRKLSGSGKGRFAIRGRYATATVNDAAWTVTDRCASTTVRVTKGTASVRDKRRTIRLKAPKSYTARAKR